MLGGDYLDTVDRSDLPRHRFVRDLIVVKEKKAETGQFSKLRRYATPKSVGVQFKGSECHHVAQLCWNGTMQLVSLRT